MLFHLKECCHRVAEIAQHHRYQYLIIIIMMITIMMMKVMMVVLPGSDAIAFLAIFSASILILRLICAGAVTRWHILSCNDDDNDDDNADGN